ncbi:MAG: hypothetical protein QOD09_1521 [Bradyrhizobium sp.]|nr:hypothetical protein [Bradyrhizobium sp.]MEA2951369.1 hypothetical protein [Alphaproteobacteria bacterium]
MAQRVDRMRRVGVLSTLTADDPEGQARIAVFRDALQALGCTDGRSLHIDIRWSAADASLPRAERGAEYWWPAVTILGIVGGRGRCRFFAELTVRYGLRKGDDPPPEPDPSKKTTHWGKPKLKRDE